MHGSETHVAASRQARKQRYAALSHRRGTRCGVSSCAQGCRRRGTGSQSAEEPGVSGHHIFIVAVERATFHNPDLQSRSIICALISTTFRDQVAPSLFAAMIASSPALLSRTRGQSESVCRGKPRRLGLSPHDLERYPTASAIPKNWDCALLKELDGVLNVIPAVLQTTNKLLAICVPIDRNTLPPLSRIPAT